jgi:hypothetical protein
MKVVENLEVPRDIIERLKLREFRPRNYSVSKLICCPRKTYFRMVGRKEVRLNEVELIFARGRAHHGVLEIYKLKEISRVKHSKVVNERGEPFPIYGDIDMVEDRITEIFTTTLGSNKVKVPEDAIKVFPLKEKQLRAYLYFEGEYTGDLLVFFLFGDYTRFEEVGGQKFYRGIKPLLRCFTFEYSKEDLLEIWDLMNNNIAEIEMAKKKGVPPLMIGDESECSYCGYYYACYGEEPVTKGVDKNPLL